MFNEYVGQKKSLEATYVKAYRTQHTIRKDHE